jgi:hypothetical protein
MADEKETERIAQSLEKKEKELEKLDEEKELETMVGEIEEKKPSLTERTTAFLSGIGRKYQEHKEKSEQRREIREAKEIAKLQREAKLQTYKAEIAYPEMRRSIRSEMQLQSLKQQVRQGRPQIQPSIQRVQIPRVQPRPSGAEMFFGSASQEAPYKSVGTVDFFGKSERKKESYKPIGTLDFFGQSPRHKGKEIKWF